MSVKQLFKGLVKYPTPADFKDLPEDYQYQPENTTQFTGNGRVLTLEEALTDIDVGLADESGECSGQEHQ